MKKLLVLLLFLPLGVAGQTLEECQEAARRNYPAIRQHELVEQTTQLNIQTIAKGWLPQVSATAQATLQSDVVALPDALTSVVSQMGSPVLGLKKDQYRVGVDVVQTLYDGGSMRSQRDLARAQGRVEQQQNEVDLYQVRARVNELYFGLLLLDDRIRLTDDLLTLLTANEQRLAAMYKRGTAAQSDWNTVRAELLGTRQQQVEQWAQRRALCRVLAQFCGLDTIVNPTRPPLVEGAPGAPATVLRPELQLIDSQLRLTDAREKALDALLRPRLSAFATGFYGYPGYDMYHDMFHHDFTFNGMVGARLTWNIGALYTRKADRQKLGVRRSMLEVQRETFLLNNRLEQTRQREAVARYRQLMADDDELIALRVAIRQAAESKLAHGIIDANDLVKELANESAARTRQSLHAIELLKQVYDLRYTVNQ